MPVHSALAFKGKDDSFFMGYKRNPNLHLVGCYTDLDDLAKVCTLIKGKGVPNKSKGGMAVHVPYVKMTIADYFTMLVHQSVQNVQADEESLKWAASLREKHLKDYWVKTGLDSSDTWNPKDAAAYERRVKMRIARREKERMMELSPDS